MKSETLLWIILIATGAFAVWLFFFREKPKSLTAAQQKNDAAPANQAAVIIKQLTENPLAGANAGLAGICQANPTLSVCMGK